MDRKSFSIIMTAIFLTTLMLLPACQSKQRMGMVRDQKTGLLYGSMTSSNLVVDPSQFDAPRLKLTIRNTSGDPAVNLKALRKTLEDSYQDKGYKIVRKGKYNVHLDINLRYSGQISQDIAQEVTYFGAGSGAYAGARIGQNTDALLMGAASGAAIGSIVGQYATQDTYIMIADVVLGLVDKHARKHQYIIEFGDTQIKRYEEDSGFTAYKASERSQIAVYAGGDCTAQSKIVNGVTLRFKRILQDII